jgi:release factor glutamine methyltransferase
VCVDVGSGSGCIGITCALEMRDSAWVCTDVSPATLAVATQNAHALGAEIFLQEADLLDAFVDESVNIVASNPPYIASKDVRVDPMVRKYEPEQALFSGEDGLETITRLVDQAQRVLKPDGILLFEFGQGQALSVRDLLANWQTKIVKDLAGIERVAIAKKDGGQ